MPSCLGFYDLPMGGCGVLEGAGREFVPLSGPLLVSAPSHSLSQKCNEVAGSLRHGPPSLHGFLRTESITGAYFVLSLRTSRGVMGLQGGRESPRVRRLM